MMLQLIDKKNRIVIYLIFLFILSTTSNKTIENQRNYLTTINKISVKGLSKKNNLKIQNKLDSFFYKNIFIIGKKEINKIISEYNIIEEYNIKKVYPSELKIDIKPTKILAKISGDKELFVGSNGKLIKMESTDKILPYIFGEFKSKKFLRFKEEVENSKFKITDFKSIFFFPSNRWDVLTVDDTLIKLSENDLSKALNIAYKVIKSDQFDNNKLIDLRISKHLIVK